MMTTMKPGSSLRLLSSSTPWLAWCRCYPFSKSSVASHAQMPRTHKQTICIFDFIKLARFLNSWYSFLLLLLLLPVVFSMFQPGSSLLPLHRAVGQQQPKQLSCNLSRKGRFHSHHHSQSQSPPSLQPQFEFHSEAPFSPASTLFG